MNVAHCGPIDIEMPQAALIERIVLDPELNRARKGRQAQKHLGARCAFQEIGIVLERRVVDDRAAPRASPVPVAVLAACVCLNPCVLAFLSCLASSMKFLDEARKKDFGVHDTLGGLADVRRRGFYSTAPDHLRFCQMLLDGGSLDGTSLLGRKRVER